jgi:hypothetical protein
MADDQKEDDMPNWTDLVNNHTEKADAAKMLHVTLVQIFYL